MEEIYFKGWRAGCHKTALKLAFLALFASNRFILTLFYIKSKFMRKQITTFLLFNSEAEEAANFYVSVFGGKMLDIVRYSETSPFLPGKVMTATFEILGMTMTALNWGQEAKYSETISFSIEMDTQEETDHYWSTLIANGGEEGPCGWLKDKYGVSWQVTPTILPKLMKDPDPKKATAVMQSMMKMKKIVIKDLQEAYDKA